MGQISYGQVPQYPNSDTNRVEFFYLRDDGDEAVVRIMHDSPATFDIVAVHPYQVNGKFRNINCIRNPQDDIDQCPLCSEGVPLRYRFYVHLLEYIKDAQGNIRAIPKVWERNLQFADTIRDFCSEYSPLSDYIFKIKRCGKKGSTDTTYNVIPANPSVYRPELYPKDANVFKDYSVIGTAVYNTDYNGLLKLLGNESASTAEYTPKQQPNIPQQVPAQSQQFVQQPAGVYNAQMNECAYAAPPAPSYSEPAVVNRNPWDPLEAKRSTYEPPTSYQQPVNSPPSNVDYNARGGAVPPTSGPEFVRPRRYAQ